MTTGGDGCEHYHGDAESDCDVEDGSDVLDEAGDEGRAGEVVRRLLCALLGLLSSQMTAARR